MKTDYFDISISTIGQAYGELRMIDPPAETVMERSMSVYGQLTPIVVINSGNGQYELVDGFKRLRVAGKLGYEHLFARVFPGNVHTAKAAMIHLNMKARTISDLEKGLVIQSLHRDDGLTQTQIAVLLNRHKSWVCRRLSLAERLCEEVKQHLKLGLIHMTIGRELAKLPQGNQPGALKSVLKHRLNGDETAHLVSLLLNHPQWDHSKILDFPEPILDKRFPDPPKVPKPTLIEKLVKLEIWLSTALYRDELASLSDVQQKRLLGIMDQIEKKFNDVRNQITPRQDDF